MKACLLLLGILCGVQRLLTRLLSPQQLCLKLRHTLLQRCARAPVLLLLLQRLQPVRTGTNACVHTRADMT